MDVEQASERVVTTIRLTVVPQRTRFDDAWVSAQGSGEPAPGQTEPRCTPTTTSP